MNDEDLLTTVRDGFAAARMTTPAEAIADRGRSLRRRRHRARQAAVGGVLALALGAGLGVSALTAGAPGAARQVTLAAWTVSQHSDGSIGVTIRELRDLPALQARLAADGARVTISNTSLSLPHGCVAVRSASQLPAGMVSFGPGRPAGGYVLDIRPSLIPAGQVLRILLIPGPFKPTPPVTAHQGTVTVHGGPVSGMTAPGVFFTLVSDTAQCTS
jgi:hypothetical protein